MSKGTDKQILGKKAKYLDESNGGRPGYNRDIILRNLKVVDALGNPRYSNAQIARMVGCGAKTVGRARKQALKDGTLVYETGKDKAVGIVEADFESEVFRASELSFSDWLDTKFKDKGQANTVFNFTVGVWEKVWDKCSMVEFTDRDSRVADQCAIKFLQVFGEDTKRIRSRLKKIRYIFRFLDRGGPMERHLSMSESKHPRNIRKIDQITFNSFPKLLDECLKQAGIEYDKKYPGYGPLAQLFLEFKLCTQMRTGDSKDEREIFGLKKGGNEVGKSYIVFEDWENFRSQVFCKKSEVWRLIWLPEYVRAKMYEHIETLENGDFIFGKINNVNLIKIWRKLTEKKIGVNMSFHDLRKVGITWFYVLGIPLEVGSNLNVGWKDLSTVVKHYADIKPVLRLSKREEYAKEIPDWFKEGLQDFMGHDTLIPQAPTAFAGGPKY